MDGGLRVGRESLMNFTSLSNEPALSGSSRIVTGTRTLSRGIQLLRVVASRPDLGWRLSDLAKAMNLDKATVHRMLMCLVNEGLVEQRVSDKHFMPGPMLFELGMALPTRHQFHRFAERVLEDFAKQHVGTILFLLRSDTDFVCSLLVNLTGHPSSTMLYPGARRPMITSAGGAAILLALPSVEKERVLRDNLVRERARYADTRLGAIQKMLDISCTHGFGVNLGFLVSGSHAFALSVLDRHGEVYGSVCLIGHAHDYPCESIEQTHALLRPLAQTLQDRLKQLV